MTHIVLERGTLDDDPDEIIHIWIHETRKEAIAQCEKLKALDEANFQVLAAWRLADMALLNELFDEHVRPHLGRGGEVDARNNLARIIRDRLLAAGLIEPDPKNTAGGQVECFEVQADGTPKCVWPQ